MTSVLITGTSSGIGRATALRLARHAEMTVYATARRLDSIKELADAGARLLELDVTDEESMRAAVAHVEAEHGAVGALVNNAGYGEYGPLEEVPPARARAQVDTNVFGLARMCQLALPGMRAAGVGRIVNIASMGGRLTFPGGGWYHASTYAVEALSDVLRFEVAPFGMAVSIIEPGLIKTGFGEAASSTLARHDDGQGPYAGLTRAVDNRIAEGYRSRLAVVPDKVAAAVEKAVTARRPRPRYVTDLGARILIRLRRALGDRGFEPSSDLSSAEVATPDPRRRSADPPVGVLVGAAFPRGVGGGRNGNTVWRDSPPATPAGDSICPRDEFAESGA